MASKKRRARKASAPPRVGDIRTEARALRKRAAQAARDLEKRAKKLRAVATRAQRLATKKRPTPRDVASLRAALGPLTPLDVAGLRRAGVVPVSEPRAGRKARKRSGRTASHADEDGAPSRLARAAARTAAAVAPVPNWSKVPLDEFGQAVLRAYHDPRVRRFHDRAFLASLHEQGGPWPGLDLEGFKRRLLDLHRAGKAYLTRFDLRSALPDGDDIAERSDYKTPHGGLFTLLEPAPRGWQGMR